MHTGFRYVTANCYAPKKSYVKVLTLTFPIGRSLWVLYMIDFLGNWLGLVSTNVNTAEEREEFKSILL